MVLIPSVFAEAFPIDFIVTDNVPPVLEARPRAIRSHGHIDRLGRTMMTTMLMMGALMPGLEYPRIREWGALRKRGVETTGIVTAKEIVNSGKSRALVMRYRFGETEGSETVTRHEYDRLNAGDTIPVTYVPGNEWANAPVGRADLTWPVFLRRESGVVVAVLMLMGMALALRLAFRLISKHSGALARDGVAVVGEVTAANRHRLEYTYDTTGGRQTGRAVLGKKKARALPAPGDHIVVLYNAAAPEKSAALAMLTDAVFESLRPMAGFVA
jgi:hypothetical protein